MQGRQYQKKMLLKYAEGLLKLILNGIKI